MTNETKIEGEDIVDPKGIGFVEKTWWEKMFMGLVTPTEYYPYLEQPKPGEALDPNKLRWGSIDIHHEEVKEFYEGIAEDLEPIVAEASRLERTRIIALIEALRVKDDEDYTRGKEVCLAAKDMEGFNSTCVEYGGVKSVYCEVLRALKTL